MHYFYFAAELKKIAALTTPLKPHQKRVVERIKKMNQPGLVVAHGLGSGKTLTSIAAQDALGLPADVVVPAALRENYRKEVLKHTKNAPPTIIHNLEALARKGGDDLTRPFLVVDEAHRIRNAGKGRKAVMDSKARKRLALTASLIYNHPSDISGPINFVAGDNILPDAPGEFTKKYFLEKTDRGLMNFLGLRPARTTVGLNPATRKELQHLLDTYVDYHPGSADNFPSSTHETVPVEMTPQQLKIYDSIMATAPPWVRRKVLRNLPPSKTESRQLNAFLSGVRQVANATDGFSTTVRDAPKVDRAVQSLRNLLAENENAKAVVYSNYLDSGINPYKERLNTLGIPYGEFSGRIPKKQRDQMVKDYNEGRIKALLLSSAGGEGLDLKGTRLIQVLDPHWNKERTNQVIGRGIRFGSHSHLPKNERNVRIQQFVAVRPRSSLLEKSRVKDPGYSVDQYLRELDDHKEQLNEQVRNLLIPKRKN